MKYISAIIGFFILAVLIAGIALIYSTCSGAALITTIDKTLPSVTEAPLEVATVTKIFQAKRAVLNDDKSVTMTGWYERDGKKWVLREGSITLPSILRPRISKR